VGFTAATTTVRQVTQLYLAEVQPPYAGGTTVARAEIYNKGNGNEFVPVNAAGIEDTTEVGYLTDLIVDGETFLVRFDYKGEWYQCQRSGNQFLYKGTAANPGAGTLNGLGYPLPPGCNDTSINYVKAKPFQILRGPRRVGNPLELTSGACIDLAYSGIGLSGASKAATGINTDPVSAGFPVSSGTQPTDVKILTFLFTPAGGVEGVYVNTSFCSPQGTVHLLVGRVDKVDNPAGTSQHASGLNFYDPEHSNLADGTSLWVSIGRTSGTVTTSENLPDSSWTAWANRTGYIAAARQIATGREQMGGR
jgi:hypothetical protein